MTEPTVSANKVVAIKYRIRDASGRVREQRDIPITYIHGGNSELFPEIEAALDGRPVGFTTSVVLTPEQAFGYPDPDLVFTDSLDNVPPELRYVGAELDAESESGDIKHFRVTKIEDGALTVDANHPLAGQTLTYDVTITGIRDASPAELATGEAAPDMGALA